MEEFAGAIAEIAEGNGDFLAAGQTQKADGGIAKGGEILRTVPSFYLALIFAERDVAHPMQAIFDTPVALPMSKERRCVGTLTRETADGVLNFDRRAAFALGRAFETANLSQTGPIEMPGQSRAGLQMPLNRAAVPLRRRASLR